MRPLQLGDAEENFKLPGTVANTVSGGPNHGGKNANAHARFGGERREQQGKRKTEQTQKTA